MKIVIAGATGFLGKYISNYFCERGHHVIGLTRKFPVPNSRRSNFEWVHWLGDDHHWEKCLENAHIVINLCGKPILSRWSKPYKAKLILSRVKPTMHLSNAIKHSEAPPKLLINASAIGYYQTESIRKKCDEASTGGSGFIANLCSDWELAAQNAKSPRTRVVLLRIGMVLSNENGAFPPMLMSMKTFLGGPGFGNGEQGFPWIHIADLAKLIDWISTTDIDGPVNAVAPNTGSVKEFTRELGSYLKRPSWFRCPKFLYDLVLGRGLSELMFTTPFVEPKVAKQNGFKYDFSDLNRTFKDLCKKVKNTEYSVQLKEFNNEQK